MDKNIIKFCKTDCCPYVEINGDKVNLGDPNGSEGVTTWNINSFKEFVKKTKEGLFDNHI